MKKLSLFFQSKKAVHMIILFVFVAYLLSVNSLYTTYILKNGKPIQSEIELPYESNDIHFGFEPPKKILLDGQYLYELRGFVYHEMVQSDHFEIYVVFHTSSQDLIFNVDPLPASQLFADNSNDKKTGFTKFRMVFAKNVLKIENYQVGILLTDLQGKAISYKLGNDYIVRLPSKIQFTAYSSK